MAFKLRAVGNIHKALMYGDTCTIARFNKTVDEFGDTVPARKHVVYRGVKCKISFSNKDNPSDSNGVYMPILKQVTIYCGLEYDIKSGDYIEAKRTDTLDGINTIVKGRCGQPNRFDSHQELAIDIEEEN